MKRWWCLVTCILLWGCSDSPLNSPYPNEKPNDRVMHQSFAERPKTLDPAKAYSSNEYAIINQIYEPPLQYHYLKRPYQLTNQTAVSMPKVSFYDKAGKAVKEADSEVAYTIYTIQIKPGIRYQPHPAFAKDKHGKPRYHSLTAADLEGIESIADFKAQGSRELKAQDYVYQIKRLATPRVGSPIAGLMKGHIKGFAEFANTLKNSKGFVDLRKHALSGVKLIDDYTYQITIKGRYPQFLYWLAMPFFAPVPYEVDKFYASPVLADNNLTLAWYPVGTGAFYLTENNPNRRMVLQKNPNYHPMYYPTDGSLEDKKAGLLKNQGKRLPLLDTVLFSLEKESIPRWNKFLQGYYDASGINADSFDAAIRIDRQGKPVLTDSLKQKHLRLQSAIEPSIFYMGFNMLDKVVGGNSKRARLLRRAIAISLNYEEYIAIFLNGRGLIAQGPIPPGISGYVGGEAGINPYVYQWVDNKAKRYSIAHAKALMKEAGYDGKRELILNYDVPGGQAPEQKAQFAWFRKQFKRIGISLNIRATQYNRFQEKMRTGSAQLFSWGWHADYPDPENFLFLLTSNNAKALTGGENAANYQNKSYDKLFDQMKNLHNGPQRDAIIKQMVSLLQKDGPWVWGFYPKTLVLNQGWVSPTKLATIGSSTMKYVAINTEKRESDIIRWNQPKFWPLALIVLLFLIFLTPVAYSYWRRLNHSRKRASP